MLWNCLLLSMAKSVKSNGGYKWQKLQNCADYFGYKFKTHDSYEDAKATLYCYHKIMERKEV